MSKEELDKLVEDYENTFHLYLQGCDFGYRLEAKLKRAAFYVQVGILRELLDQKESK